MCLVLGMGTKYRLIMSGYTPKFEVEVDGTLVLFEPDEDQRYRTLIDEATLQRNPKLDVGLKRLPRLWNRCENNYLLTWHFGPFLL